MSDLAQRIADLSPEQRARLERQLLQRATGRADEPAMPRRAASEPCPLSFAQQRLWFLEQLEPNRSVYNIAKATRLRGVLDPGALNRALQAILSRHEALRTTFVAVDGVPVQRIAEQTSLDLSLIDLSDRPREERDAKTQTLIDDFARGPFDLSRDLPLRAKLVRLAPHDHVLVVVMHHIASDGWSMGIFSRELATFYDAFSAGNTPGVSDLPIQYADFAVWQRQWLEGDRLASQLAYWKQRLTGAPSDINLPTDRPRPEHQTYRGARQSLLLPASLTEKLQVLSRGEGCTLFMMLLAAFQVLLARYTGQDDIVVGSPIAGRNRLEIEGLIGFFVNTLALRTDLSGNPTFRELLSRVRDVALGAYAHQDLPFEKLVEELQPERNLSQSPLFQVMFQLRNVPSQPLQLRGLEVSEFPIDTGVAMFDLSVAVTESPEGLVCQAEYNTDLFDRATIGRMLGHYQTLLDGIADDPDRRIANLPILTAAERQQVLIEWNQTAADYPSEPCLHELFEAQVARTPGAVAVVFEDEQLTYRELNTRANRLAHCLRARGVGPETLVGICMERSLEMVVAILGVLKAGGAYVPLDPSYPRERLAFMVQDANAPVLLTQERLRAALPESPAHVFCLDTEWGRVAGQGEANPSSGVSADNLAYVIHTSGSTGQPKGVMISHRAITNHMLWMHAAFPLTEADRVFQKTPISADASVWEFHAPLMAGARLVMAQHEGHRDSAYMVRAIVRHEITILQLVPSMLRMIVEEKEFPACRSLRRVFCGGEVLAADLVERFFAQLDAELHNLYGPTETAIDSIFFSCPRGRRFTSVPIGRPIANTQIYLLDRHQQPVAVGVPGDLYIGGAGVGRGYLNRPELTAERFIPSPFSDDPASRLYCTGDLGRYKPDGNIEFLGRVDHQIKIRGARIEPGEIEVLLRQHPGVRETVVALREDVPGEPRLVAYVVPHDRPAPEFHELRRFLNRKLPEYMVPSAFVLLEALPLTPNSKVDRRALPAPSRDRPELEPAFVAPSNATERTLAAIWADVLGLERVGIHDNFFELGGHSLLATRVISRIRDALHVELPLRRLFETPTVADLALATVQSRVEQTDPTRTAQILAELEHLSDDEVKSRLGHADEKADERPTHLDIPHFG